MGDRDCIKDNVFYAWNNSSGSSCKHDYDGFYNGDACTVIDGVKTNKMMEKNEIEDE